MNCASNSKLEYRVCETEYCFFYGDAQKYKMLKNIFDRRRIAVNKVVSSERYPSYEICLERIIVSKPIERGELFQQ